MSADNFTTVTSIYTVTVLVQAFINLLKYYNSLLIFFFCLQSQYPQSISFVAARIISPKQTKNPDDITFMSLQNSAMTIMDIE